MQYDNPVSAVLRKGQVTIENQELYFTSIIVKKEQTGLFLQGQSDLFKDDNKYVMNTNSRNPLRYKADLQTVVEGSDGFMYACAVEVGNTEFNLHESIPAMVYPYGYYRDVILQDE